MHDALLLVYSEEAEIDNHTMNCVLDTTYLVLASRPFAMG